MRQISIILVFVLSRYTAIIGQEFIFPMIFEDAVGSRDTLLIGYDTSATDSIDVFFDEKNIIATEMDSIFGVRISNEWENRTFYDRVGTYHTKKNIVPSECRYYTVPIVIDIKAQNWPVTAYWDHTLFEGSCRQLSVFTSTNPGGWWDTGSPSNLDRIDLIKQDSITFSSNASGSFNENYAYHDDHGATIPVFWFSFADSSLITASTREASIDPGLVIYPNPAKDFLKIEYAHIEDIKTCEIIDALGYTYLVTNHTNNLWIGDLGPGIYFLKLTLRKDKNLTKRFSKI